MAALTRKEKEYASMAFHYLVTPAGMKFSYSARELVRQEPSLTEHQVSEIEATLERLSSGEFPLLHQVTLKTDLQDARYEIHHTPLGPALLDWRIRFLTEQQEREYQEKLTVEKKIKQEEAYRKWQRIIYLFGVIVVVMSLWAVVNLIIARTKERARAQLEIQKVFADEARGKADAALETAEDDASPATSAPLAGPQADNARTAKAEHSRGLRMKLSRRAAERSIWR